MYATLLANVTNVLLNYLLIFGKFGFPEMGIVGAAYGTLVSRVVMVAFIWWILAKKERSQRIVTNINIWKLEANHVSKIISLGAPSAMQMLFEVGIFTAAIWLSGLLGKNPQAANQIALNLSSMTFMVATGLSVTAMIRIGNQRGLQAFVELRRIAYSIFLMGLLLALGFAILFFALNEILPNLYVDFKDQVNYADNLEVVEIASKLLIAAAIFQISDSIQVMVLGALRGLQDVLIPTLITFISYWFIGFPISYYFGNADRLGSFGIWLGLLGGLSTAAVLLYIRFNILTKKLIKIKHHELT
jgi:MATE family multidrug resistance protein